MLQNTNFILLHNYMSLKATKSTQNPNKEYKVTVFK